MCAKGLQRAQMSLRATCEAVSWVIIEEQLLHLGDIICVIVPTDGITINYIHKPINIIMRLYRESLSWV